MKLNTQQSPNEPEPNLHLNSDQNNPRVPYKTRWRHPKIRDDVIVAPYTTLETLVQNLQEALNKDKSEIEKIFYKKPRAVELKSFYQNAKGKDKKTPKRKSCYGWTIEFFKNKKYIDSIEQIKNNTLTNMVTKYSLESKPIWVHECYPIIDPVEIQLDYSPSIVADRLNATFMNPKYDKMNTFLEKDCQEFLEQSFPLVKSSNDEKEKYLIIQTFLNKMQNKNELIKKLSKPNRVSPSAIIHVLHGMAKTTGGWSLQKEV